MRYIVTLRDNRPASPPPAELMEAIMKLGEEATKAGALLDQGGLAPSAEGARVAPPPSPRTTASAPCSASAPPK